MNWQLFISSLIIGIIITCITLFFNVYFKAYEYLLQLFPLYLITGLGIYTSINNHLYSSKVAKDMDRITMCFAAFIYLCYTCFIKDTEIRIMFISLIVLMCILYLYSKYIKNKKKKLSTIIHMIVHCLVIIVFSIIITEVSINNTQELDVTKVPSLLKNSAMRYPFK
jgi:hypothetical protein